MNWEYVAFALLSVVGGLIVYIWQTAGSTVSARMDTFEASMTERIKNAESDIKHLSSEIHNHANTLTEHKGSFLILESAVERMEAALNKQTETNGRLIEVMIRLEARMDAAEDK